ncbi:hypothetical protein MJG53_017645 [Ovis ammon polii x Ovis aries]|uniref:Uncharacterized protein n=1 Tax=Ovis ammon polii x Ovis aries TaxID=2918886 RepID=A0ACB9U8M8_9CETA|nr:hypothetical protein MJG53_017645 [Ovis ammon polii x Ovis aries]
MLTAGLPLDRFRLDFIVYKQAQRSEANFPKCHSRKVAETGCEIKNTLSTYLDFSLLKGPCKNYGGNSDSYNGDDGSNTFSEEMNKITFCFVPSNEGTNMIILMREEIKSSSVAPRVSLPWQQAHCTCKIYGAFRSLVSLSCRLNSTLLWLAVSQFLPGHWFPGACLQHLFSPSSERHLNRESRDSYRCKPAIIEHESDHGLETDASKLSHFGSCTNNSLRTQSILHKKRYQKQTQCGGLTPMAPEVKMLVPCTAH